MDQYLILPTLSHDYPIFIRSSWSSWRAKKSPDPGVSASLLDRSHGATKEFGGSILKLLAANGLSCGWLNTKPRWDRRERWMMVDDKDENYPDKDRGTGWWQLTLNKNPLSHWHMHLHFATATVVLPEIAIPKSAAKIRSFPSDARPYQLLMHINSSYLQLQLLQLSFRHLVSTFCSLLKRILASSARMWRPELSQLSCRNNHCAMSPFRRAFHVFGHRVFIRVKSVK